MIFYCWHVNVPCWPILNTHLHIFYMRKILMYNSVLIFFLFSFEYTTCSWYTCTLVMCIAYILHFLCLGVLIFTCLAIYYDSMHVHLVTYTYHLVLTYFLFNIYTCMYLWGPILYTFLFLVTYTVLGERFDGLFCSHTSPCWPQFY